MTMAKSTYIGKLDQRYPFLILGLIILLGALLRFVVALNSDHIYYPDELFQVLEQGFRLSHGYGITPLEYVLHIRSYLLPQLLAQSLRLMQEFGLNTPNSYIPAVKILFSLLSLSLIPSIYLIIKSVSSHRLHALLAAFSVSIWYELVYFAHRPFYEVIATYLLYVSLALSMSSARASLHLIAGFLLALSLYLRPHYLPVIVAFFLINFFLTKRWLQQLPYQAAGFFLGSVLAGFVDYISMGTWFYSLTKYVSLNLGRGTQLVNDPYNPVELPSYFYFTSLLTTSLFILITLCKSPKVYRPLLILPLFVILSHSLIDHKEYRFIFAAIPMLVALASISIMELLRLHTSRTISYIVPILVVSAVSVLGITHNLPGLTLIYPIPPLAKDPNLHVYKQISQNPKVCGLFDATRRYELTGGYYYIGANIPLYNHTYPPPLEEPQVNLLITRTPKNLTGYTLIDQQPNLYLYYSNECQLVKTDNQELQNYP